MRTSAILICLSLVGAAPSATSPSAKLRAIVAPVSQAELRHTIQSLVGFGTRHTLSSQTDPHRGIGAALHWAHEQFAKDSAECGNCLTIVKPGQEFTGQRIPKPTMVYDMVAIQRGTERPNDVVIIQGHIDSRVTDIMNSTSDAPGANDDGSGTAVVMEAARILSKRKFPGTIVYATLSGEEQGLYGGKVLADYAKANGWNVVTVLNNDIVGNSCSSDNVCDSTHARILSEGPRSQGQSELAAATHSLGGENDAPSRNISRFLQKSRRPLEHWSFCSPDLANRPVRTGRRPYSVPSPWLSRSAHQRRGRKLQLATPGRTNGKQHPLRRHHRPCRFCLSFENDKAERRCACCDCKRSPAS